MKNIEAIIFDADGVIFDSEKLWDIGDGQFMANRGVTRISEDVKLKLAGTSLLEGTELLLSSHGITEDLSKAARERIEIMESLYATSIEFMEGFKAFYQFIKDKPVKKAVATSMSKHLFPLIDEKLRFLKMFDHHVYSVGEVEKAKPAPDIYLYAAKQIETSPENCLVIEDAPNGIKAAKAAGMTCIGLASTFTSKFLEEADITFTDFSEIQHFIEKNRIAL